LAADAITDGIVSCDFDDDFADLIEDFATTVDVRRQAETSMFFREMRMLVKVLFVTISALKLNLMLSKLPRVRPRSAQFAAAFDGVECENKVLKCFLKNLSLTANTVLFFKLHRYTSKLP
jgi:hypothetical protein